MPQQLTHKKKAMHLKFVFVKSIQTTKENKWIRVFFIPSIFSIALRFICFFVSKKKKILLIKVFGTETLLFIENSRTFFFFFAIHFYRNTESKGSNHYENGRMLLFFFCVNVTFVANAETSTIYLTVFSKKI